MSDADGGQTPSPADAPTARIVDYRSPHVARDDDPPGLPFGLGYGVGLTMSVLCGGLVLGIGMVGAGVAIIAFGATIAFGVHDLLAPRRGRFLFGWLAGLTTTVGVLAILLFALCGGRFG